jgi:hypothetical protein
MDGAAMMHGSWRFWGRAAAIAGGCLLVGFSFGKLLAGTVDMLPALAGAALLGLGYMLPKPPKPSAEEEEARTLLFAGDMEDPVQRSLVIRLNIAMVIHLISLAYLVTISLVSTSSVPQVITLAGIAVFFLSMIWFTYESWRFYQEMDDFWWDIAATPAAMAGVITICVMVLCGIAETHLGLPQVSHFIFYGLYWAIYFPMLINRATRLGGV